MDITNPIYEKIRMAADMIGLQMSHSEYRWGFVTEERLLKFAEWAVKPGNAWVAYKIYQRCIAQEPYDSENLAYINMGLCLATAGLYVTMDDLKVINGGSPVEEFF